MNRTKIQSICNTDNFNKQLKPVAKIKLLQTRSQSTITKIADNKVFFGNLQKKSPLLSLINPVRYLVYGYQILTGNRLLSRHGIDIDNLPVVAPDEIRLDRKEKKHLVIQALKAHEMALVNSKLENFSGRYKATTVELSNGLSETATNMEISRDTSLCGERSAFVVAWNKVLKSVAGKKYTDKSITKLRNELYFKRIVMATSNFGEKSLMCSECETWLTSQKYFMPDTQTAQLVKNSAGKLVLEIKTKKQLLPFVDSKQPSLSNKQLKDIDALVSKDSDQIMKTGLIDLSRLVSLLQKARQEFETKKTAQFSGKNMAVAALLSDGTECVKSRFDITKRWFVSADTRAVAESFDKSCDKNAKLKALAYYGEDPDIPPPTTSGYWAQHTRGGPDTLIVFIKNGKIHIETLREHHPFTYISDFKP